jgi:hypothetical protein
MNPMKYPQSYLALEAAQFDRQPRMAPPLTWDDREAQQIPSYEQTAISPDPLIDLGAGFSGGFGANIMRKGLSSALRSGIAATLAEYPIGLATAGAANIDPRLAMPVSIMGGMASGPTFERALSNAMAGKGHPVSARRALGNSMGIFGGLKSQNQPLRGEGEALIYASRALNQGMDPRKIRRKYHWFKGMDGKWRYEIDDSKMKFKKDLKDFLEGYSGFGPDDGIKLGDVIDHDYLFKAYPQLKNIPVGINIHPLNAAEVNRQRGAYNPFENTINIKAADFEEAKDTLVHELQHAVQHIEGFARGGSPDMVKAAINGINMRQSFLAKELDRQPKGSFEWKNARREYDALMDEKLELVEQPSVQMYGDTEYAAYSNLAGEIESRDASKRRLYSPMSRSIADPETTGKYGESPIVRFGKRGIRKSYNSMEIPMLPPPETAKQHLARATARHDAWKKKASRMADQAGKKPVVLTERGTNKRGVIIHKSTKRPGKYQITYWDDRGFSGDTQADSLKKVGR